jgi:hypothetical protein
VTRRRSRLSLVEFHLGTSQPLTAFQPSAGLEASLISAALSAFSAIKCLENSYNRMEIKDNLIE